MTNITYPVNIPSITDIALFDGLATAFLLSLLFIIHMFFRARPRTTRYLLHAITANAIIVIFSTILMTARAMIPVGATVTNNTVTYIYARNPYSLLYLAPLALGTFFASYNFIMLLREALRPRRGYRWWHRRR